MARVTRLELAASAVTGRRSNQLSYTRAWVNEAFIIKAPPTCQRRFCVYAKKTLYSLISQDSRADDTQYRYANYDAGCIRCPGVFMSLCEPMIMGVFYFFTETRCKHT